MREMRNSYVNRLVAFMVTNNRSLYDKLKNKGSMTSAEQDEVDRLIAKYDEWQAAHYESNASKLKRCLAEHLSKKV